MLGAEPYLTTRNIRFARLTVGQFSALTTITAVIIVSHSNVRRLAGRNSRSVGDIAQNGWNLKQGEYKSCTVGSFGEPDRRRHNGTNSVGIGARISR